jgi:glycosyltransferase involved in cell wall biosynthesis
MAICESRAMISALILTLDEEVNVGDCIASLPWRSDVHVLDSGSRDRTQEIARTLGAKVTERPFTNYADQRNFGLALPFAHKWVVMIDADERMTPELAREIEQRLATSGDDMGMLCVRRKDMFMGRWLRRSSGYPTWFPRVMRHGRVHVEREINEVYACDGRTCELTEHLVHHPFNKGIDWWFERHGRYASAEARLLVSSNQATARSWFCLLSRDPRERRVALKRIAYRLPWRPFLSFLYLYVVRLGFLDGRAGYHYANMRMACEVMIDAKVAYWLHDNHFREKGPLRKEPP